MLYPYGTPPKRITLPWFRIHTVVINDPGRLISIHLVHSSIILGWAGSITFYELTIHNPTDPILDPLWRQSDYVIPQMSKLGVIESFTGWSTSALEVPANISSGYYNFEVVGILHFLLGGLLLLASFWHWVYWDLDLFYLLTTNSRTLDLIRVFGIHLTLASMLCFGFGYSHLAGNSGPGCWTSDESALTGTVQSISPSYSILALNPFSYGTVVAHHAIAGAVGLGIGLWHTSNRPDNFIFTLVKMFSIESVLSSSIAAVFWITSIVAASCWYGCIEQPIELNGPTRFHWDNSFFSLAIDQVVEDYVAQGYTVDQAYDATSLKLVLYDYVGSNPAKGGLFRSGPLIKGDGIIENWTGHPEFSIENITLSVRRIPSFFETFPVLLIDKGGSLRADIAFRRASSRYSIEQRQVRCLVFGGIYGGSELNQAPEVKNFARKAQFGSIFTFDRQTPSSDGVFRTSIRGWYSFSHTTLFVLFFLGHLWHAARALFKQIWTGVSFSNPSSFEYGYNEKLGDDSTEASTFIV